MKKIACVTLILLLFYNNYLSSSELISENFHITLDTMEKPLLKTHEEKIRNLNNNIGYFKDVLNSNLNLEYDTLSLVHLSNYFWILKNNYDDSNEYKNSFISLNVLVGEYLRVQNDGVWLLIERTTYGRNEKYYEPAIIYSNGQVCFIFQSFSSYFESYDILDILFNFKSIKSPPLNINQLKEGNLKLIILE